MEKQSTVGYCSIHNMGVIHAIEGSMWVYADESLGDIYAIFMDDDGNGHDFVLGKKEWNQIADRHNKRLQKKLQGEDCCHLFVCFGGIEGEPTLALAPLLGGCDLVDEYRSDMMKLGLLEEKE